MIPEFLKTMLEKQYGTVESLNVIKVYEKTRPLTMRVNTIKSSIQEIEEILKKKI